MSDFEQKRDTRLDALRGVCLVDVVLVHLAYDGIGFPEPLDTLIKHYTRFAAGGFVFLAGLTVAVVFGPRVAAGTAARRDVHRRLLRRAASSADPGVRLGSLARPACPDEPRGIRPRTARLTVCDR